MSNDNYALIRDIGHRHVEALAAVVGEGDVQEQAVAVAMHLALREMAQELSGQVEAQRRIADLRLRWYRVAYDSVAEARAELEELRKQHASLVMRYAKALEGLDEATAEIKSLQSLVDRLLAGEDKTPWAAELVWTP